MQHQSGPRQPGQPDRSQQPLTINVEGVGGVPGSGVSAVVLNVAVAKESAAGT